MESRVPHTLAGGVRRSLRRCCLHLVRSFYALGMLVASKPGRKDSPCKPVPIAGDPAWSGFSWEEDPTFPVPGSCCSQPGELTLLGRIFRVVPGSARCAAAIRSDTFPEPPGSLPRAHGSKRFPRRRASPSPLSRIQDLLRHWGCTEETRLVR